MSCKAGVAGWLYIKDAMIVLKRKLNFVPELEWSGLGGLPGWVAGRGWLNWKFSILAKVGRLDQDLTARVPPAP